MGQLGYADWLYLSKRNPGTSQVGVLLTSTIGADICFAPDPRVTPPASYGSDDAYSRKVDGVFSWHIGQSFSAIVPVLKSLTDFSDSGVDNPNHSGPCVTNVASCGLPFFGLTLVATYARSVPDAVLAACLTARLWS